MAHHWECFLGRRFSTPCLGHDFYARMGGRSPRRPARRHPEFACNWTGSISGHRRNCRAHGPHSGRSLTHRAAASQVGRCRDTPREAKLEPFGVWSVSPVTKRGVLVAWGASCNSHIDSSGLACKAQLAVGVGAGAMSSDECKRRMQHWLLEGHAIPHNDGEGRSRARHMDVRPRSLPLKTADELAAMLRDATAGRDAAA